MSEKMRLTNSELRLMRLFESITDVFPITCRIYEDYVFYIINRDDYPKLIANGFRNLLDYASFKKRIDPRKILARLVAELSRTIGKRVYISFYDGNLDNFIRSFFMLSRDDVVQIRKTSEGGVHVTIIVNPGKRGKVIGRGGFRAKVGRELAKAFFNVKHIIIR